MQRHPSKKLTVIVLKLLSAHPQGWAKQNQGPAFVRKTGLVISCMNTKKDSISIRIDLGSKLFLKRNTKGE